MGTTLQRELRNVITRRDPTGAAIVTDANVRPWAVKVAKAIKRAGLKTAIHAIPAGERSKSMVQLDSVLSFLERQQVDRGGDRKSTRLNSSHLVISYAVFCLKKKKKHH